MRRRTEFGLRWTIKLFKFRNLCNLEFEVYVSILLILCRLLYTKPL